MGRYKMGIFHTEMKNKSINFEKIILDSVEKRAKENNSSVSNLVNWAVRKLCIDEIEFYRQMAGYYQIKLYEYEALKDIAIKRKEENATKTQV